MKIKVAEATEAQLDWLVASCKGLNPTLGVNNRVMVAATALELQNSGFIWYRPSTDPAQGQPLLEQAGIAVRKHSSGAWYAMLSTDLGNSQSPQWNKEKPGERYGTLSYQVHRVQCRFDGPTMLIAGLRCLVASELGVEADVPAELA